jgi:hypothetical protein
VKVCTGAQQLRPLCQQQLASMSAIASQEAWLSHSVQSAAGIRALLRLLLLLLSHHCPATGLCLVGPVAHLCLCPCRSG